MTALSKFFRQFLPDSIKRLIDPDSYKIDDFVISTVKETDSENLILDAGAGECKYKNLPGMHKYIAIDTALGDQKWNYSMIDVLGSLDNLPVKPNVFGTIICTQVLEHVNRPQIVLNELFSVLKEGGNICLTAPQGWGVHQAPHDYFRFTNHALLFLLKEAGFIDIVVTPSCGYFGYLANRLTVFPKTLFWQIKKKWLRLILLPIEFLSYLFFVVIFPIVLNAIDPLDREQNYTLNYFVKGKKPDERKKQA